MYKRVCGLSPQDVAEMFPEMDDAQFQKIFGEPRPYEECTPTQPDMNSLPARSDLAKDLQNISNDVGVTMKKFLVGVLDSIIGLQFQPDFLSASQIFLVEKVTGDVLVKNNLPIFEVKMMVLAMEEILETEESGPRFKLVGLQPSIRNTILPCILRVMKDRIQTLKSRKSTPTKRSLDTYLDSDHCQKKTPKYIRTLPDDEDDCLAALENWEKNNSQEEEIECSQRVLEENKVCN